ncbi:hypothetical protein A8F72_08565 [Burkholderia cenocepacia]|nr:hypothetical protein TQ36_36205 [Burkholderia cenocepacia]PRF38212.1 hypothetical protein C6Q10_16010 [Burkholderia multivorans]AQQ48108.1 hypothetical protein A8F32_19790 [Burkholderia cenocepacia]ONJ04176.1 hypothetical protein A8F33_23720 [Burkholderia cenocepacia]ONJ09554.1 hypothetical protein A8F53_00870 [Burkholderia cenocepacia]
MKTHYASPQTRTGMQYSADMTRFGLDCAGTQGAITAGKVLDALDKVTWQSDEPAGEIQLTPEPRNIDTATWTMCTAGSGVWRSK